LTGSKTLLTDINAAVQGGKISIIPCLSGGKAPCLGHKLTRELTSGCIMSLELCMLVFMIVALSGLNKARYP
jgi:hypothetical protein